MKRTLIFSIFAVLLWVACPLYAYSSDVYESSSKTDKKPTKKKGEIKEVTFDVHLHCDNCVKKVQENIAFEKGVKDLDVNREHQTVKVKYDAAKTSEAVLEAAIEKLGYEVYGTVAPGQEHGHGHDHDHGHTHGH